MKIVAVLLFFVGLFALSEAWFAARKTVVVGGGRHRGGYRGRYGRDVENVKRAYYGSSVKVVGGGYGKPKYAVKTKTVVGQRPSSFWGAQYNRG